MPKVELASSKDAIQIGKLFHEDMKNQGIEIALTSVITMLEIAIKETQKKSPQTLIWVIRENENIMGALLVNVIMSLKFSGKSIWIEELYVSPTVRRKGFGRLLIEHLIDYAERQLDINGIDLEAYQGNTPASILYRSLGFKRLGRERFYYKFGDSEYL